VGTARDQHRQMELIWQRDQLWFPTQAGYFGLIKILINGFTDGKEHRTMHGHIKNSC
jgi:hypothetical protein